MTDRHDASRKPHVILFKSQSCPHCPTVLKIFRQMEQQDRLAGLKVYDVAQESELAAAYGVRSVPWFKIDSLEFQGLHNPTELDYWVSHAGSSEGIKKYMIEQLEAGQLHGITKYLKTDPIWQTAMLDIIADLQSPMQARIGIGAVLEELAGAPLLVSLIPAFAELSRHNDHSVRADACHYLGLTRSALAGPHLEKCLDDPDPDVREIARDSLAMLPD